MKLLEAMFWEFLQNVPLVAGFILSLHFGGRGQWPAAVACLVGGSVAGALVIATTESKKVDGHREPPAVMLANAAVMSLLALGLTLYLLADWSNWRIDLLGGGLVAVALSAVQSKAAKEPIGLGHTVAFALAFPLALIAIRFFTTFLPPWVTIVIITTLVTVIITVIDYGPIDVSRGGWRTPSSVE